MSSEKMVALTCVVEIPTIGPLRDRMYLDIVTFGVPGRVSSAIGQDLVLRMAGIESVKWQILSHLKEGEWWK